MILMKNLLAVMACLGIFVACNAPAGTITENSTTSTSTNVEANTASNTTTTGSAITAEEVVSGTTCDCSACPGNTQNNVVTTTGTTTTTTGTTTTTTGTETTGVTGTTTTTTN